MQFSFRNSLPGLMLLLLPLPAMAQTELLSYNFDDAVWTSKVPWGWNVSNGVYRGTNTTPDAPVETYWTAGYAWTDYVVAADVS